MRNVGIIFRRELAGYFATPLAYVFIVMFLLLTLINFLVITSILGRDPLCIGRNQDGIPESQNPPVDRGNKRLCMGMTIHATFHGCHLILENEVLRLRLPEGTN